MTAATSITVRVPLAIRHRPGRKTVVTPMTDGMAPVTTRADPTLVKALARAFRYQRMLDNGIHGSVTDMAGAEKIDRGYLGRLLQLTLLCPDIVEGILDGKYSKLIGLPEVMRSLSTEWGAQRAGIDRCDAAASLSNPPREHEPPSPGICHGL